MAAPTDPQVAAWIGQRLANVRAKQNSLVGLVMARSRDEVSDVALQLFGAWVEARALVAEYGSATGAVVLEYAADTAKFALDFSISHTASERARMAADISEISTVLVSLLTGSGFMIGVLGFTPLGHLEIPWRVTVYALGIAVFVILAKPVFASLKWLYKLLPF